MQDERRTRPAWALIIPAFVFLLFTWSSADLAPCFSEEQTMGKTSGFLIDDFGRQDGHAPALAIL